MPSGYTFDSSHGPGVSGSSSRGSSSGSRSSSSSGNEGSSRDITAYGSSGRESGSKDITAYGSNSVGASLERVKNTISNIVGAAGKDASAYGQAVRESLEVPFTSASGASSYFDYLDEYGLGFDMDEYFSKLKGISDANNAWSEAQAEKQMQFQRQSDASAMAWSAAEAQKNRDWQLKLSDTAHQREMKDLLAAGLNPILASNQGAYTGSGATGQGFSSSGAMGNVDTSITGVMGSLMSNIMSSAKDIAVTRLYNDAQKYQTDKAFAASKLAAEASIYNNNNSVSAQKAISQLNRDADIQKAGLTADATRAAAAASAGAMMSAAATNASAARYSADQHLAGIKRSSEASEYSARYNYLGKKYEVDNDWRRNPLGYVNNVEEFGQKVVDGLEKAFDGTNYKDYTYNSLGSE